MKILSLELNMYLKQQQQKKHTHTHTTNFLRLFFFFVFFHFCSNDLFFQDILQFQIFISMIDMSTHNAFRHFESIKRKQVFFCSISKQQERTRKKSMKDSMHRTFKTRLFRCCCCCCFYGCYCCCCCFCWTLLH